jgi:hypothetical protein
MKVADLSPEILKDTTYAQDAKYEWIDAGRLAICEKMSGTDFYIYVVYHEWFIVENELGNPGSDFEVE